MFDKGRLKCWCSHESSAFHGVRTVNPTMLLAACCRSLIAVATETQCEHQGKRMMPKVAAHRSGARITRRFHNMTRSWALTVQSYRIQNSNSKKRRTTAILQASMVPPTADTFILCGGILVTGRSQFVTVLHPTVIGIQRPFGPRCLPRGR